MIIEGLRRFLRVTGLAIVFVLCTAIQCLQPTSEIQYSAGHGYVIQLKCTYTCSDDYYYVVFDTYQQAADWLADFRGYGVTPTEGAGRRHPVLAPGYKALYGSSNANYDSVAGNLDAMPSAIPVDSIDLNQPHPFVPQ